MLKKRGKKKGRRGRGAGGGASDAEDDDGGMFTLQMDDTFTPERFEYAQSSTGPMLVTSPGSGPGAGPEYPPTLDGWSSGPHDSAAVQSLEVEVELADLTNGDSASTQVKGLRSTLLYGHSHSGFAQWAKGSSVDAKWNGIWMPGRGQHSV